MSESGKTSPQLKTDAAQWPRWLEEITRLLSIRSQIAVSGNIRDVYLVPAEQGYIPVPVLEALWRKLSASGYEILAVYDRTDGLSVVADTSQTRSILESTLNVKPSEAKSMTKERFLEVVRTASTVKGIRIACVIDYASRLVSCSESLGEGDFSFFAACEKAANAATPVFIEGQAALYNPLIWLINRANDLPSWLMMDNERIGTATVPLPDYETRRSAALVLGQQFKGFSDAGNELKNTFSREFANHTDGMTLQSMVAVSKLARESVTLLSDVDDAVRSFKVGMTDQNPWKQQHLRERIRGAKNALCSKVKGQDRAVNMSVDILMRSIMGMTGAQSTSTTGRPRGVMFFAGPTGVGKTELAKRLTELLFNDPDAYIRFDMSEFAQEHSDARLLGAPPGYVGYDAGGELTRAVREKPFSIILFDEIEKAHPRILDKFLQILEDGRLTDGRGDTVYFSESVIIFTSNLGIYVEDAHGEKVQNVKPGDPFETVEKNVRNAIVDYFKFTLNRPEILNRIGDNIIVFNFIVPEAAAGIFTGMLGNIISKVKEEHGLELLIPEEVRCSLMQLCTADMTNGGRGIGNKLETHFVNPLARALFEMGATSGQTLTIAGIEERADGVSVQLV